MIHVRREGVARGRVAVGVKRDEVLVVVDFQRDVWALRELLAEFGAHGVLVEGRGRLAEDGPDDFKEMRRVHEGNEADETRQWKGKYARSDGAEKISRKGAKAQRGKSCSENLCAFA